MSAADPASGLPLEYTLARRAGLIAFGVVLTVLGSVLSLAMIVAVFGILEAAEQWLMQPPGRPTSASPPAPPLALAWDFVLGIVILLLLAGGTLATGIGCCLARRWVRPVVIIAAALIMVTALLNFVAYTLTLPSVLDALDTASQRNRLTPSPYAMIALFAIRGTVLLVVGVVLPYLAWRFFMSHATQATLDLLDPRTIWSDRRPIPVLAWVALCGLIGAFVLARLGQPALPAFTTVVKGSSAIIGLSAIGVLMAWGAWLCFRADRLGWVVTFLLLVGLRLSTAVFLWTGGDPTDLLADAGAAATVARMQRIGIPPDWLPKVMATIEVVLLAAFGLYVARNFPKRYDVGVLPGHAGGA